MLRNGAGRLWKTAEYDLADGICCLLKMKIKNKIRLGMKIRSSNSSTDDTVVSEVKAEDGTSKADLVKGLLNLKILHSERYCT